MVAMSFSSLYAFPLMQSYRRSVSGLFLLFCIYTPVAVLGGLQGGEYFPVFNWSLFTHVKRNIITTEIQVDRIGDRILSPPQRFFALKSEFSAARKQDVTLWKTLTRYRVATNSDEGAAEAIRRQIEAKYLRHGDDVHYRIVTSWYDALDRYHTGTVQHSIEHGRFVRRAVP